MSNAEEVMGCSQHFVYIVECSDGTLYTGYTRDVEARVQAHNAGQGAKYTRGRRPVRLLYVEAHGTMGSALRREREVKGYPRADKLRLVQKGTGISSRSREEGCEGN